MFGFELQFNSINEFGKAGSPCNPSLSQYKIAKVFGSDGKETKELLLLQINLYKEFGNVGRLVILLAAQLIIFK